MGNEIEKEAVNRADVLGHNLTGGYEAYIKGYKISEIILPATNTQEKGMMDIHGTHVSFVGITKLRKAAMAEKRHITRNKSGCE